MESVLLDVVGHRRSPATMSGGSASPTPTQASNSTRSPTPNNTSSTYSKSNRPGPHRQTMPSRTAENGASSSMSDSHLPFSGPVYPGAPYTLPGTDPGDAGEHFCNPSRCEQSEAAAKRSQPTGTWISRGEEATD